MTEEDGYVLSVRKNALKILIPKYGLEAALYLGESESEADSLFTFDAEVCFGVCHVSAMLCCNMDGSWF